MSKNVCLVCESPDTEKQVCVLCEPTFLKVYEHIIRQDPDDIKDMDPFETSLSLTKCRLCVDTTMHMSKKEATKFERAVDTPEAKAKRWEEALTKYESTNESRSH
jgi:hypothetical protein